MKFSKKRMTGMLAMAMVVALGVTSLAIFTDRSQSTATAKAGTLDLQLTQSWAEDNKETLSHFAPGDILDLNYTLVNDSTLAAKVREKFVITSDKEIPADTFQIWKKSDLAQNSDTGFWAPKNTSVKPIQALVDTAWNGTIMYSTYTLPQFLMDGTHADQNVAETSPNTDTNTKGQVYANNSAADHYVILFNKNALTSVGGANIGVEYLAEAMQNSGTNSATNENAALWSTVANESINFMTGVSSAVPVLDFDPGSPETPVEP